MNNLLSHKIAGDARRISKLVLLLVSVSTCLSACARESGLAKAPAPTAVSVATNTKPVPNSFDTSGGTTPYLFAYFENNGEDGLHLAWSPDGYKWNALGGGKSYLTPMVGESKLMRDPCLMRGPDGIFRMVWTTSWEGKTIGYASSKDLVHWSEQKSIPVMNGYDGTLNCWAPEISYDDQKKQYVIFWASTITGKFSETLGQAGDKYNHRIYSTTTKDFSTFTPAKLMFDPGYIVIDSTIVKTGDKYRMIYKDETEKPAQKNLHVATSDHLEGPYSDITPAFSGKDWVEGPTAIKVGDWFVTYYDVYGKGHYGASRTKDFVKWEDVSSQISLPQGIRHGTAIPIAPDILEPLVNVPLRGMVGVGTWETQAEFKDIVVTRGDKILFDSAKMGDQKPRTFKGQWAMKDGVLSQTGTEENAQALLGDPSWSNYTLSLKARKTGGKEGFLIKFLSPADETTSWWNLGGWGDTKHSLQIGGFPQAQQEGSIETGRWYDIKLEQNGNTVKAYLDGKLIHEVTAERMSVIPPVASQLP